MRAVVLGLVGAVLAAGGAQAAASCPISRTVYQVVDTGNRMYGTEVTRPDLVGQKLTVSRQGSSFRSIKEKAFSEPTEVANLTLLLEGQKGRFIVERSFTSHSSPSVTAMSWPGESAEKQAALAKRERSKEKHYFRDVSAIDVLSGPLESLQIKPVACQ